MENTTPGNNSSTVMMPEPDIENPSPRGPSPDPATSPREEGEILEEDINGGESFRTKLNKLFPKLQRCSNTSRF
jgi:hypothetical protein